MGEPCALRKDELQAGENIWRQATFEKIWTYYQGKSGLRFA
jgi:hypothetical protein